MSTDNATAPGGPLSGLVASAVEYMLDAGQRSVLFLDVMRQRGDQLAFGVLVAAAETSTVGSRK